MQTRRFFILILQAFLGLAIVSGGELRAQIMFEDIRPNPTSRTDIRAKEIPLAPLERMEKPSKAYAPMPHFQQHVIQPDRIKMEPLQRTNLRPKEIRINHMTFSTMVKDNIRPREIRTDPLVRTMSPGRKEGLPPPTQLSHWAFNPTAWGNGRTTIQYSTSIRTPMFDYNSPYHKNEPPMKVMHPMAW